MTQSAVLAASASPGTTTGFKNKLINGNMTISQRNGTSSTTETGAGQYTLDRWQVAGASPGVFTVAQSSTAPAGFINSLLVTVTTADASLSGASYQLQQKIEGFNIADLAWGTSDAKSVNLSFWVRSSVTGTFGGALTNSNYDWTYPFSYTISAANTWTQATVSIAGPTSGTWLTTNGIGMFVIFGLGAQVARTAAAGVWANTVARQSTGSVNLIATNGATFYLTGVQLEVGTTATNFDYRSYGTELSLCQRYFAKLQNDGTGGDTALAFGMQTGTTNSSFYVNYPVTMRSEPTVAGSNIAISDFLAFTNALTLSGIQAGYNTAHVYGSNASSGAQYRPVFMSIINNTAGYITLSAEL